MIDYLIGSICLTSVACVHALNAFTIQTGIKSSVEVAQQKVNQIAVVKVKSIAGPKLMAMAGSSVYIYKVVKNKELSFSVPTLGICDDIRNVVTLDSYLVKLEWKL